MEEQADGQQMHARIKLQRVESRRLRIFEDQRRCLGMTPCGLSRDRCAQSSSVENDR